MSLFRSVLVVLLFVIAASGSAAAATVCPGLGAASECCDDDRTACPMAGPACSTACVPAMIARSLGATATSAWGELLLFSPAIVDGDGHVIRPPLPPPRAAYA